MSLITSQNYELSAELQRFLQTDEVVKKKLNRKGQVDDIKSKVDYAIRKSQNEVEKRRSPVRSVTPTGSAAGQEHTEYRYNQSVASTHHVTRGAASSSHMDKC